MSKENTHQKTVAPVSPQELLELRDGISSKFGAYLRPGESVVINAERTAEHAHASIVMSSSNEEQRLEMECASVPADREDPLQWDASEALDLVVDLLDAQLESYFEDGRFAKLHDDWRMYELDGVNLRFRGVDARPNLEALADAWLANGGDPTKSGSEN